MIQHVWKHCGIVTKTLAKRDSKWFTDPLFVSGRFSVHWGEGWGEYFTSGAFVIRRTAKKKNNRKLIMLSSVDAIKIIKNRQDCSIVNHGFINETGKTQSLQNCHTFKNWIRSCSGFVQTEILLLFLILLWTLAQSVFLSLVCLSELTCKREVCRDVRYTFLHWDKFRLCTKTHLWKKRKEFLI